MIFAFSHGLVNKSKPRIFNDEFGGFSNLGFLNNLNDNKCFYKSKIVEVNKLTGERDGEFDKNYTDSSEYYMPLIRNFS